MKKIAFTLVIVIVMISIVIFKYSGYTDKDNSDKELGIALMRSMEETQKDNKKLEQLFTKVSMQLNNKGYDQIALGFSNDNRILTVQVKDEKFIKTNKSIVETMILNVAKELEFKDFDVEFIVLKNFSKVSVEQQQKQNESLSKVSEVITEVLKEKGFIIFSVSFHPENKIIIEGTDKDLAKKEEVEKLIASRIFSKTNINFSVKIQKKSENQIKDQNWQPVLAAIREETKKEFKEYRGFAYSFHPEPLQIIIKTDLEKSKWFWNSNKKVKHIKKYIDKIIELKREELSIEEIPYEIIIRDKNDENLK